MQLIILQFPRLLDIALYTLKLFSYDSFEVIIIIPIYVCTIISISDVWIIICLYYLCSYRYGQLSGIVEPIAGMFGAIAVVIAEPILPYALAFAAGAMIYVVVDDIIPEAQTWYVYSTLLIYARNSH